MLSPSSPPPPPSCHPTSRRGRSATILLFLALTCWRPGTTQHLENDLSLLHDLDVNQGATPDDDFEVELFYKPDGEDRGRSSSESAAASASAAGADEGVKRLWGVADTEAAVGKLFSYPIPSDAFSGTVVSYQVKGLPSWLVWDAGRGAVEGVARGSDRGHHYVTVRARGLNGNYAKDVFAIHVKEAPAPSVRKDAGCSAKEDLTMLSVVLDHSLPHLTPAARVRILRTAQKFLRVKEVSLVSAPHDSDPLSEDSAIQAGPGSTRVGQREGKGEAGHTLVQVVAGCTGDVSRAGQAVVERVEGVARNGDLERALGVPVLGWHVTQTHPGTKRVRRQVNYSGDGDYYNPYYDYEYEYDDEDDDDYISEYDLEPDLPESRVVPQLATPVFPEASATPHLPDRSRGVGEGSQLHFTPVLVSTPVFVPVKPTRVVVEASPTITYQTASPHQPSGPSRTPHLESSITTEPPITAETTTPLAVPNPSTLAPTRPLEPSVGVSTEVGVKNFPPRVNKRIQKLAWVAGHVYRLPIPRDTFEDIEDGDTKTLRLVFKNSYGHMVGSSSWIQFNAAEQYIYALPLEQNIGRYSYLLEALDSENKSITDSIMIHVQQPKQGRNFNHRFTATFNIQKKYEFDFEYSLDWKIKAVQKVAEVYGDPNTDLINVRSISENPNKLTWTNISLSDSRSTTCPHDELEALAEVVVSGSGQRPSKEVKQAFAPEFNMKDVHTHLLGPCEAPHRPHHPHPQPPPPGQPDGDEGVSGKSTINMSPIIRNQIDILNTTQGSLFRYKVPLDTCYDAEDGPSSRLKMRLLTSNLSPPPNTSWLQFDPANQEFFGIPQSSDVGKAEYILECVDSGGEKVNDALFVKVLRRESRKLPPVEFSLTVSDKYSDFLQKPHRKARLIDRIGEAFGDDDARNIAIDSFQMGSVVVTWHNTSLPSEPCPNADIEKLKSKMITEDGDLKPEFVEFFGTEFNVLAGSILPKGTCLSENNPEHEEVEEHHPPVDEEVHDEDNDYLLNFIIPAVIIAAMLLLAAVIACCLYRRRRYGKMTMADDRTFVSKGIPIIFAEELDDRPDPAKSPVIMKEEKPPLPPPEYQRGSSPATAPTPPASDRRRRPHSDVADDAPSYQPPPPFTATNGASRHPRPNMPPTYRKPPTYVPP